MRYLPHTETDRRTMLAAIGASSLDDLFVDLPDQAVASAIFDLPDSQSEMSVERALGSMAAKNLNAAEAPCFLGAGNYRHHTPASLDYIIQRGEFLTAYTPYQPEVSQGTVQTIYEFQTQVALITGMEVANASMYDGATACAEAALMAARVTKRNRVLISGSVHPHYSAVTETQTQHIGLDIETLAPDPFGLEDLMGRIAGDLACVIVQYPGVFGHLKDLSPLASACHEAGALLVVAVPEPVALGAVKSPGSMGADIVIGDGQSLAGPMSFGGPGVGLFATRQKFIRQMPGRLAGETVDEDGKRGFVLTLSTREQHIRREKATSNICTNSGLIALAFSVHMTLLGEVGFKNLAALNHERAVTLSEHIEGLGLRILPDGFFNEFAVDLKVPAAPVVEALAERGVLGGIPATRLYPTYPELDTTLLLAATEMNSDEDIEALITGLKEVLS